MRKLKPLEIIALTGLMSLGRSADALEAEEVLPTDLHNVTAYGYNTPVYYEIPYWAQYTFLDSMPYTIERGAAFKPTPTATQHAKILNCVTKYSGRQLPLNWNIRYEGKYGWRHDIQTNLAAFTPSYNWPIDPGPWRTLFGTTDRSLKSIYVFAAGYHTPDILFETLVHELGHAMGVGGSDIEEDGLEAEARAALNAFKNDNGAKCGGTAY